MFSVGHKIPRGTDRIVAKIMFAGAGESETRGLRIRDQQFGTVMENCSCSAELMGD